MSLAVHGKLLGRSSVLPTDFPNLRVWVDASTLTPLVADGVGVDTWAGRAGTTGFAQATEASRPLFRATGGPGGKPCVEFDGVAFFMTTGAIAAFDNQNTVSAFWVIQEVAFNSGRRWMSSQYAAGLTNAADTWGVTSTGATLPTGYHLRAAGSFDSASVTVLAASWHVLALTTENVVSGISFSRDGVVKAVGPAQTPGSPTTHTTTFLGKQSTGNFGNIRVAEIAIYNQTMSHGNVVKLSKSLARKWGIA